MLHVFFGLAKPYYCNLCCMLLVASLEMVTEEPGVQVLETIRWEEGGASHQCNTIDPKTENLNPKP
jgi:hypothetical protein